MLLRRKWNASILLLMEAQNWWPQQRRATKLWIPLFPARSAVMQSG